MSAFYDQASLVVVPSGYKSGKIYAQKPLTTDGQLTFTRASTATRVNASGLIETVASGVPRLDYFGSSCPKILLEPQRSNTITHSQDINSCFGSKVGVTVTSDATTSPDGTANADLLKFDTTSGFVLRGQTVAAATTYTASVFVKNNNFTTGQILLLNMSDGVIGGLTANINVAAKTATFGAAPTAYTNVSGKVEDYGNGWFRVSVTGTSVNGGNGWYEFAAPSVTNSCYIWGFSLEIGSYVTSYVKTEAAAVTRLADVAQKDSITSLIGQTAGTIYWESNQVGGAQISLNTSASVSSDGVQIYASATTLSVYIQQGGTARLITTLGTVAQGSNFKIALAYGTNFVRAYINGVQTYTTSATIPMPTLAMLNLSFYGGGDAAAKSETKQVLLFKSILSNAQLAELTTL
jgi:hypothetical protein